VNKKIIHMVMVSALICCNNMSGMHGRILGATQLVTATALITGGMVISGMMYFDKKKPLNNEPMPPESQKFIRSIMKKCGDSTADTLPLLISLRDKCPWLSVADKAICASITEIDQLEQSLRNDNKKNLALTTMGIKHEIKHNMNQDAYHMLCVFTAIPITVVMTSALIRRGTNRLCNINPPTKIIPTLLRSSICVGMVIPKIIMGTISLCIYRQYLEQEADRFACEHAASREELEVYGKDFLNDYSQEREIILQKTGIDLFAYNLPWQRIIYGTFYDPIHPLSYDRGMMAIEYSRKWDKNIKINNFKNRY
jgi:hypothetical protein